MAQLTEQFIDEQIKKYDTGDPFPFLKHVHYFNKPDEITDCSIGERWSELSGESSAITFIKGKITITGANYSNEEYRDGECPYRRSFNTSDIMKALKHPCDTGIVNGDASLNIDIMKQVIMTNFEYDAEISMFIMKEDTMNEFLKVCKQRDADVPQHLPFYMPSYGTVAYNEWKDFYYNYCDRIVNKKRAVTLHTFLQFYFQGDVLYERKLGGELPVKPTKK